MVSEAGASVYSASEVAREEFPNLDVTVRGAISIARRLQDPLAELIKIDPKSIGVGQYQHDVNQARLKRNLDDVVDSCVNSVGVNLNTASHHLLAHVAGIGPSLAKTIVDHRATKGILNHAWSLKRLLALVKKFLNRRRGFCECLNQIILLRKQVCILSVMSLCSFLRLKMVLLFLIFAAKEQKNFVQVMSLKIK